MRERKGRKPIYDGVSPGLFWWFLRRAFLSEEQFGALPCLSLTADKVVAKRRSCKAAGSVYLHEASRGLGTLTGKQPAGYPVEAWPQYPVVQKGWIGEPQALLVGHLPGVNRNFQKTLLFSAGVD